MKDEGIVRVSSLLDIDYKKIPFVRGGGDDGFQTPTKKINVAMEDHLLRTCQSESTGRYGGSIQDSLLKTCSSHRSGLMSVKKTIGKSNQKRGSSSKAPSFSDPAEVASAFRDGKKVNWTCGFCNWRVAVAKGDSLKVVKHIRTRHPAEYTQDSAISAFGSGKKRGVSGFGIRGIKIPVDLSGKRRGLFAPIVRRAPQRISPDMSGLLRRGIT